MYWVVSVEDGRELVKGFGENLSGTNENEGKRGRLIYEYK